jgi:hypothetical protein
VQAFDIAIAQRADAILVGNDTVMLANRRQVVERDTSPASDVSPRAKASGVDELPGDARLQILYSGLARRRSIWEFLESRPFCP